MAPDARVRRTRASSGGARTWLGGLVLGAIGALSCRSAAAPAVPRPGSSFGQGLSLAMSLERGLAAGDASVTAAFALTNDGSARFDGCFSPSWGVSVIVGGAYDAGHFVRAAHPSCDEKFAILPGQKIVWSRKVPLTDLRSGTAKVTGWVKIVDPAACDPRVVCRETSIATPVMTVAIGER